MDTYTGSVRKNFLGTFEFERKLYFSSVKKVATPIYL